MSVKKINQKGFTLIELIICIAIVAVLVTLLIIWINPPKMQERANYANTVSSLNQIAKAAQIYMATYGTLPLDANRDIPTEFMPYLGSGPWPDGPFAGSVYDWDNWTDQTCWDGSTGIIQVTLRQVNNYKNKTDYTLYYVIQGVGVPHCSNSATRGECLNCPSRYP
jgi:prepilin-type N-terminal cleavage/methylation domain-containing protein